MERHGGGTGRKKARKICPNIATVGGWEHSPKNTGIRKKKGASEFRIRSGVAVLVHEKWFTFGESVTKRKRIYHGIKFSTVRIYMKVQYIHKKPFCEEKNKYKKMTFEEAKAGKKRLDDGISVQVSRISCRLSKCVEGDEKYWCYINVHSHPKRFCEIILSTVKKEFGQVAEFAKLIEPSRQ